MENVVDCVLRNLVASRSDIFTRGSIYSRFKREDNFDWTLGLQSNALFGRIVYKKKDGESYLSEPLVLKMSPKLLPFGHDRGFQKCTFANEISFYIHLVPLFHSLRPCALFPIYYNSLVESNVDHYRAAIIFENVQTSNYVPSKRKSFLDLPHLLLMVRKLGEFHAYSFKSCQKDENRFKMMANSMINTQVGALGTGAVVLRNMAEQMIAPLAEDPKYTEKAAAVREKLARLDENLFDVLRGVTKDEQDVLVLCHGDYLCSNVMFQYDDKNDDTTLPIDMKIVDMASCRMASPVVDLALVLYMHTTQTMRYRYWDQLIDEYYTALKTTFPQIEVPSLEQIYREIQHRAFHVYYIASFFLGSLIARDDNTLPQMCDMRPEGYESCDYADIPVEVLLQRHQKLNVPKTTDALIDMLKDMIDRGIV